MAQVSVQGAGELACQGFGVEDRLDDLGRQDRRLGDQHAHRGELAGVTGTDAAVVLGGLDLAGDGVEQDLLAGAKTLREVDHREVGGLVQHGHDDVVAT